MDESAAAPASAAPVRVLQVIGNAIVGGMETWVERCIERLPRSRIAFSALCPFESPYTARLRALGVEVIIAPMPDEPPWTTLQTAAAHVNAAGIELLHAHLPKAHLLAGLVGRLTGRPVLTTIHGRQLTTLDVEVHRVAGTHLSVVCQQTFHQALALGVDPARLSLEKNGVDTQAFRPPAQRGSALRDALGLPADAPLVGFVGRLAPEKGPEVALRAMQSLQRLRPDAQLVLVGEGELGAALREQAQQSGLAARVHFAGLRQDMPHVYAELDVLLCPSHSEAMPLAVLEAMACGVPVVATWVGGVPEVVEHGESGYLVPPGAAQEIAQRVATLLGDDALRQRFARRARERCVEQFALDDSLARVERLLLRLARAEPARRSNAPAAAPAAKALRADPARHGNGNGTRRAAARNGSR